MKETFETKTLLGVLSTEIYEMLPIHYYRCSFNNNSVDMVNRHGFCFNERDSDKIRAATSLNDVLFTASLDNHHGVLVTSGQPRVRYVIFYDDSFFKAYPDIFRFVDKAIVLKNVKFIKKGDPIYARLPGFQPEWSEDKAYPLKCKKVDDYTVAAYSTDPNDYFFMNFELTMVHPHVQTTMSGKPVWMYKKKFATKEEADKTMEIFQFYRM